MIVSLNQLDTALSKIKYGLLGYGNDAKDLDITVEFIQADPGKGIMVDCMLIKAVAPQKEDSKKEVSMSVEIFPAGEQQLPRASKTESFTITDKY